MDTKITGIINERDTRGIQEWVEKLVGSVTDIKTEMADIQCELSRIGQALDVMQKKISHLEPILEKVSD
ncbi:hypothetical protein [Methanoregula sp.]|uniref:hypothetical protein n=1 Tax=Methanoregula sp. TaxID=2052170 RepID=UPI003567F356